MDLMKCNLANVMLYTRIISECIIASLYFCNNRCRKIEFYVCLAPQNYIHLMVTKDKYVDIHSTCIWYIEFDNNV